MRNRAKVQTNVCLERDPSLFDKMLNFFNTPAVKRTINVGNNILNAISPFIEEPNAWNGLKMTMALGEVFTGEMETWSSEYFNSDDWVQPCGYVFTQIIIDVINKYPYKTVKTSDTTHVVRLIDIDGIKLGYVYNTCMSSGGAVHVETAHQAEAKTIIKKMLWKSFKDSNLVMRRKRVHHGGEDDEGDVVFAVDDVFKSMVSARAIEYSAYLTKCMGMGYTRSVLLYGPPGTGKSTLARTLVDMMKYKSFRINVQSVDMLSSSVLYDAVDIFEPDAIILDDFDRAENQVNLLETLEYFQHKVKLVIATANDRNKLDEAILRPGRFDELLFINKMDDDVIRQVLGPDHIDAFDDVKDWPIAFIQEYAKRRKFMTREEAVKSTEELAERVKRLDMCDDESDVIRMQRLLEKKNSIGGLR